MRQNTAGIALFDLFLSLWTEQGKFLYNRIRDRMRAFIFSCCPEYA
jgi:hypothetical protein